MKFTHEIYQKLYRNMRSTKHFGQLVKVVTTNSCFAQFHGLSFSPRNLLDFKLLDIELDILRYVWMRTEKAIYTLALKFWVNMYFHSTFCTCTALQLKQNLFLLSLIHASQMYKILKWFLNRGLHFHLNFTKKKKQAKKNCIGLFAIKTIELYNNYFYMMHNYLSITETSLKIGPV